MLVQVGLCQTCSETTLLVFPRDGSNVNRLDPKTGKIWIPEINSRICSKHFVDGEPSLSNPHPTLFMGHTDSSLARKKRRQIKKHDPPVLKKRKISLTTCTIQEDASPLGEEVANSSTVRTDTVPKPTSMQSYEEEMTTCENDQSNEDGPVISLSDLNVSCNDTTKQSPKGKSRHTG